MKRLLLILVIVSGSLKMLAQGFNNNSQKSYINIAMPKTPESQSFEKYGNIPLDEFSGTASISVPLYNVQGKYLSVPVSLTYHSSGIKVNQEATWVGLGFDLMTGGRITLETKGNVDENVRGIAGSQGFKDGLKRIFNKWKVPYSSNPNSPQIGYAFLDYAKFYGTNVNPWDHMGDTLWDDNYTVTNAAWYGAGEPDIYHASFLGQSVNFYFDIITGNIEFTGEKSLFSVSASRDYTGLISVFTITDNSGIKYLFEQSEKTKVSVMPNFGFASNVESRTAWLLTKVIHPSGDNITFAYSNFGKTYPAFTWSASISCSIPYNGTNVSEGQPNQVEQDPYYLTKIESGTTTVDFILSNRDDLRGEGARKLDRIEIKDKTTGVLVKKVSFVYDYFTGIPGPYENTLAENVRSYYLKRLKLLSVTDNSVPGNSPWVFSYKNMAGPGKLSFSQDHWGYFNAAANATSGTYPSFTSAQRLIPSFNSLGSLATRNIGSMIYSQITYVGANNTIPSLDVPSGSSVISTGFNATADRNCYQAYTPVYMMDSITYPTGGASRFEYEVHRSHYLNKNIVDFTGGGLRIKSIKNFSSPGKLENITEYDYMNSGIYLGAIEYIRIANKWPGGAAITMSTNGDMNNDKQAVGYASVRKTVKDYSNTAKSGYSIKYFKVDHPQQVVYSNVGHPFSPYIIGGLNCGITDKAFLLKQWSDNAPNPKKDLDGKMYLEEVYNNTGTKVKQTSYYYRQSQQTNHFYSLRVADNYNGYPGILGFQHEYGVANDVGRGFDGNCGIRWIRWEVCITPNVSYFTVLDSVVDKTLDQSGNYITEKKAYTYNAFSQQEFAASYNSDGSQSVIYTRTPLSFTHPSVPSPGEGEALLIEQMKTNHIYDLPIEQVSIRRTAAGDSLVTGSVYNVYEGPVLKKVYALESGTPLVLRSQFVPAYYYHNYPALPSFNVVKDSRYKLQETADYLPALLVKDITTISGKKAFIWDELNNNMLAACVNAASADIAFTSFETAANGNWNYTGTPVTDALAPTGGKVYALNAGAVSRTGIDPAKTFIVSYWSKNGPQTVSGSSATATGRTLNGYTSYEHTVINPAGGAIQISGSGTIDELRLFPAKSMMTSYTYKPLVGVASQCDANNRISYYQYDAMNRLAIIRDQDRNVLKKICYNYAGQPENCNDPCTNTTANWQNTTTPPTCQQGSCGNTGYQLQEQRDINTCSPTYNQTQTVLVYNPAACTPAAGVNITYQNFTGQAGFTAVYTNLVTLQTYTFSIPASGNGVLGCIPAGAYSLNISKPGNLAILGFETGCSIISGTSAFFRKGVQVGPPGNCNSVILNYSN